MTARRVKTPAQRAQERLAVAERAVERLTGKAQTARKAARQIDADLEAAVRRRDYVKTDPDLPTEKAS